MKFSSVCCRHLIQNTDIPVVIALGILLQSIQLYIYIYLFNDVPLCSRTWRSNIDDGKCVIVTTSIAHAESKACEGVPATVLASRYLIEPAEYGRSRLTHVYRVDLRLVFFVICNPLRNTCTCIYIHETRLCQLFGRIFAAFPNGGGHLYRF